MSVYKHAMHYVQAKSKLLTFHILFNNVSDDKVNAKHGNY